MHSSHSEESSQELGQPVGLRAVRQISQTCAELGIEDYAPDLFAAAAAFYRASPWTVIPEDRPFRVTTLTGAPRTMCIYGSGGERFGVWLLPPDTAMRDQLSKLAHELHPDWGQEPAWPRTVGMVSLSFHPRERLSEAVRREIDAAGWEVAGPAAYPSLEFDRDSDVRVRQREAEQMTELLEAIPRFVAAHQTELVRHTGADDSVGQPLLRWQDTKKWDTGIADIPNDDEPLWDEPEALTPAEPEGPGARPGERLSRDARKLVAVLEKQILARFSDYLRQGSDAQALSKSAAGRHASIVKPFVRYLLRTQGIPIHAGNEHDLRYFLYRAYPHEESSSTAAEALPGSLRLFFAFLQTSEGVWCPWAAPILADRRAFFARFVTCPFDFMSRDMAEWLGEIGHDLTVRAFLPYRELEDDVEWDVADGGVQQELFEDLKRRWLGWRDEVIRSGVTDSESVLENLAETQRLWAGLPNPICGGETPTRAIAAQQRG